MEPQTNPTPTPTPGLVPPPPPKRVKRYPYMLTLHISERQKIMLDCMSGRMQVPVSELIRRLIDELIEKYGDKCEETVKELVDEEFPTIRGR
jgi:hypothetical protein